MEGRDGARSWGVGGFGGRGKGSENEGLEGDAHLVQGAGVMAGSGCGCRSLGRDLRAPGPAHP